MHLVSIQLINLCYLNIIGKDLSLIDKLMKGYVLKIFITGDICHFGLTSLTEEPRNWAKQLSEACY